MKLEGKVAIITGGGGAMGGAQARLFAREGAAVCVADLFADKAQAVASDLTAAGGQAFLFVASDDAAMVTGSMLTVDGGAGL